MKIRAFYRHFSMECGSLDVVINNLNTVRSDALELGFDELTIEVNYDYAGEITIWGMREETEKEKKLREKKEKQEKEYKDNLKKKKEEAELKEYNRLKKKFEGSE